MSILKSVKALANQICKTKVIGQTVQIGERKDTNIQTNGRMDATKRIISLALRPINIQGKLCTICIATNSIHESYVKWINRLMLPFAGPMINT